MGAAVNNNVVWISMYNVLYLYVIPDGRVDKGSNGAPEGEKLHCTTPGGGKLLTIVYSISMEYLACDTNISIFCRMPEKSSNMKWDKMEFLDL